MAATTVSGNAKSHATAKDMVISGSHINAPTHFRTRTL